MRLLFYIFLSSYICHGIATKAVYLLTSLKLINMKKSQFNNSKRSASVGMFYLVTILAFLVIHAIVWYL